MKIRIGLVGLGDDWKARHRPALRTLSDRFEVRAVCEPIAHRAAQVASEFGAEALDGFRAMVDREDVDAILVLSGRWYGSLPIFAACDAGKAVYCAAASELETDRATEIRRRVDEAGIAFMAEFACRWAPATVRLKELMATHLGPPRLVFCHRRRGAQPIEGQFACSPMSELIEAVDWCRYVVGSEPTSVFGVTHRGEANASFNDYEMMSLDFSPPEQQGTGVVAQISCGQYIPAGWTEAIAFRPPAAMQVACERGIAFIDPPSSLIWFDHAGRHMESLNSERPIGEQLLCDFHRAVTSLVHDKTGLDDAYQTMSILCAARSSSQQGARVAIESPAGKKQ